MKTATFPSLRVDQELRDAAEEVLQDGESLSSFIEGAVRQTVERRKLQTEFIARGLLSRDEAHRTDEYVEAEVVLGNLQRKLDAAQMQIAKNRK